VVYHHGSLPSRLPNWFVELDSDCDGQVALYEWKQSGRPLEEFRKLDLNQDGFVTVEELLRYLKPPENNQPGFLSDSRVMAAGNPWGGIGPGPGDPGGGKGGPPKDPSKPPKEPKPPKGPFKGKKEKEAEKS